MPVNTELASHVWRRFSFARDHGHAQFIEKADRCEAFFAGKQWDSEDVARLRASRRPHLTVNKIISTISNVMGEQIYNRAEISFRPRSGAPEELSTVLSKVFKQISDNTQLDWKRSDAFADGIITSRGFLDARIEYGDNMQGEVAIEVLNPKNVIVDPDAEAYDPDTWNEVFTTKWVTADDIAVLYNQADAEILRNRGTSYFPYGYDSIQAHRDRFGDRFAVDWTGDQDNSDVQRNLRVIERQHRRIDRQKHFVVPETGDMRPIPEDWTRERIAFFVDKLGFQITTKLVRRIRWTVICDSVVLHDDWSPYEHFTVVPYFPYFRHGHTIGLVENLLDPQELLNKVLSQELHAINTTANSGYKVKAGALAQMSVQELEQRGAETGIVIELNDMDGLEKIEPNAIPQGLDHISQKAEGHIDAISGISESMKGFDREDVAAKAIQAKRQAGSTNLAKPMDSLTRSDFILARHILCMVQATYTEPRLLTITKDAVTGQTETVGVNQPTPDGQVLNDLTIGEYDVIISSVPQRETLEDSQFEQLAALKEMGIQIPDKFLIQASRAIEKKDIIEAMEAQSQSPAAQAMQQLQQQGAQAEVAKTQAETKQKDADAELKLAKAGKEHIVAQKEAATPIEDPNAGDGGSAGADRTQALKAAADIDLNERKFAHQKQMDYGKQQLERQKAQNDAWNDAQKQANDAAAARAQATNSQPTTKEK